MDSIRTNFSELFAAIFSDDSMTILIAFLMTWFIGWLMRYMWDRFKINALKESLEKSAQEKVHFKGQWENLQEKYALQEADLKKANLELTNKTTNLEAADAEKRTLNSRLNATLVDLDKSREELQEASGRLEDLNDQILGLRTKNAQLNASIEEKATVAGQYAIAQDTTAYEKEVADLAAENTLLKNSIEALKANIGAEGTAGATLRISELEQENEVLKTQIASASTDSADTTELKAKLADLEAEKDKLEDSLAEIAQLENGNEVLSSTINTLIKENEQLKEQVEALPQYEAGNEVLNNSMQTLITENEALQDNVTTITQYESGQEILNNTITELIEKNEALEAQLANQSNNQIEWSIDENDTVVIETEEGEGMDVEDAKAAFKAAIGEQIAQASAAERDDLKQINGIGPFIEEKLNDLGIYTFEQVSQLDDDLIEILTNAIEFFPGRIERDDWVGQADRLFYTKGNTPQEMTDASTKIMTSRYATATEKIEVNPVAKSRSINSRESVTPDDLKKIEGIGPKISEILNKAGIYTFSNLSLTPVDRLKSILAEAGNRFKIHDPQTWPQQATLAAAGEWDQLKSLQDQLDSGRNVAKG